MKFQYVNEVDGPVNSYGHMVTTGDVVDFTGHLAEKAANNPHWKHYKGGWPKGKPRKVTENGADES